MRGQKLCGQKRGSGTKVNSTGHGTLGRIGYIEEGLLAGDKKVVPDTHVTVIRVKEGILPQYIYLHF